jgi:hypothetical protein
VAAPLITTASGTFSNSITGYYEYWTTESSQIMQDGALLTLEGAFSSETGPSTVLVAAASSVPTITMPATQNSSATHWMIYRSPKKTLATDKSFPTGFLVGSASTGTPTFSDSLITSSASAFAASAVTGGGFTKYADWASASSMFTDNGVYSSAICATSFGGSTEEQGLYSFVALNVAAGPINGIQVEVQGYVSLGTSANFDVSIGKMDPVTPGLFYGAIGTKSGRFTSTNSGAPDTIVLGSTTDPWTSFSDSDFATNNVLVVLKIKDISKSIGVDYVKMTVYYGGGIESTIVYPTVIYSLSLGGLFAGNTAVQVSKNLPPPSSNTGDLFQDSLVVNDMSNRSLMRYSFPGLPESFPPTYYYDFETSDNDVIQVIQTVNGRLVVGLDNSLWRVNFLSSENDANLQRDGSMATEPISKSVGCVGPMCACAFNIDGQAEHMAFVSTKGIYSTDGYSLLCRTKNQTWRNYISLDATSTPISLLNDPENRCLRFYYRNDTDPYETYMCLFLSYDIGDIDSEGSFKVSGPVNMRNYDATSGSFASVESAWAVPRTNGDTTFYVGYGGTATAAGAGKVYAETGYDIPAHDSASSWTSRRIYGGGLTGEWMLDDLYGYCGTYSGSPLLTYTFSTTKTNDHGAVDKGKKSITLRGQRLHKVTPKVQGEGIQITMRAEGNWPFGQELLVFGSTDYGREDAGT